MALAVFLVIAIAAGQSFILYEFTTLKLINSDRHRKPVARLLYLFLFVVLFLLLIHQLGLIYDMLPALSGAGK